MRDRTLLEGVLEQFFGLQRSVILSFMAFAHGTTVLMFLDVLHLTGELASESGVLASDHEFIYFILNIFVRLDVLMRCSVLMRTSKPNLVNVSTILTSVGCMTDRKTTGKSYN